MTSALIETTLNFEFILLEHRKLIVCGASGALGLSLYMNSDD